MRLKPNLARLRSQMWYWKDGYLLRDAADDCEKLGFNKDLAHYYNSNLCGARGTCVKKLYKKTAVACIGIANKHLGTRDEL